MKLNEFINKNREEFDSEEPSAQHFQNFASRLAKEAAPKKRSKTRLIYSITSVAASILLLAGVFFMFENPRTEEISSPQQTLLSDVSNEYKETEIFFINDVETKNTEFNMLKCNKKD